MRRTALLILIAMALILTACGSLTPPTTAKEDVQPTMQEELSPPGAATQPEATTTPECRLDISSQPDPTQEAMFPAVGGREWALGPETAKVRIIEYSDFQ